MDNEPLIPKEDERERALALREEEIVRRELRLSAQESLAKRGLPGELLDALSFSDEQALAHALDALEGAYRKALRQDIASRMSAQPPRAQESFAPRNGRRMSYQERARMYRQDRRQYDELFPG